MNGMTSTTRLTLAFAALALAAACGPEDDLGMRAGAAPTVEALAAHKRPAPTVTTYASGLNNPRGLAFGPDGNLYVTEAGSGGGHTATNTPDCPIDINIYSPYSAGFTGRVLRVLDNGTTEVVADGLPSMTDAYYVNYGPTDVAFVGETLYVLIEMGGCSHGLDDDLHLPAVLRVNADGSTTNVADLGAWQRANPPHYLKDTGLLSDKEPGGVFHSMIAVGKYLYVVETNNAGSVVRVDPATGAVVRLYDLSLDNAEHNPIVMTRRGNQFYVGTFGEDEGPSELAVFDKDFTGYTTPFQTTNPIVGLAWHGEALYAVEIFPYTEQWTTDNANLVTFDRKTGERREVLTDFASLPNGLVKGPDGALYTSNWGISYSPGDGQILRIVP